MGTSSKGEIDSSGRGDIRSVYAYQKLKKKDGTRSAAKRKNLNRSGNEMTISFSATVNRIRQLSHEDIDSCMLNNLLLLQEIRDNAIHFYNTKSESKRRMHEVASASVRNFFVATESWFAIESDSINANLSPIGIHNAAELSESIVGVQESSKVKNLLNLISTIEDSGTSNSNPAFCTTLKLELQFVRRHDKSNVPRVQIVSDDPTAVQIALKEDDMLKNFPWDYKELVSQLRERYTDFKQNQQFHSCRKEIQVKQNFSRTRYLDPKTKSGTMKTFNSPGILSEFDKHYVRKMRKSGHITNS